MPGLSGNPAGRRRGASPTRLLREALEQDDGRLAGEIIDAMLKRASAAEMTDRAISAVCRALQHYANGPARIRTGDRAIMSRLL